MWKPSWSERRIDDGGCGPDQSPPFQVGQRIAYYVWQSESNVLGTVVSNTASPKWPGSTTCIHVVLDNGTEVGMAWSRAKEEFIPM